MEKCKKIEESSVSAVTREIIECVKQLDIRYKSKKLNCVEYVALLHEVIQNIMEEEEQEQKTTEVLDKVISRVDGLLSYKLETDRNLSATVVVLITQEEKNILTDTEHKYNETGYTWEIEESLNDSTMYNLTVTYRVDQ